jgi:hypothetical protein
MRTSVSMTPRPWKPELELEGALQRGTLDHAILLAHEVAEQRARPIALDIAAQFLPLVAAEKPSGYDTWACRWFARWLKEAPDPTIEQAAELTVLLADLPEAPAALKEILALARWAGRRSVDVPARRSS